MNSCSNKEILRKNLFPSSKVMNFRNESLSKILHVGFIYIVFIFNYHVLISVCRSCPKWGYNFEDTSRPWNLTRYSTSTVLTTGYTNSLIQSDGPVYVHISGYDLTPSNIDTSITLSGSGTNTASKTIFIQKFVVTKSYLILELLRLVLLCYSVPRYSLRYSGTKFCTTGGQKW